MIRNIIVGLLLLLCLFGCRKEEHTYNSSRLGGLSVEFLTDRSVHTKAAQPVYRLDVCKLDGSIVSSYPDCSALTERLLLPIGDYKLVAHHGKDTSAAFEMPYYRAEENVKIEAGVTKNISMVCTQANVKVTVQFSQAIQDNFPNYSLLVTNEIDTLNFDKGEQRAGYFQVHGGVLKWDLFLNNGQEEFKVSKTIVDVKAQQHYKFNFDIKVDGSAEDGAFVPGIKVDTTAKIVEHDYEIVLKDPTLKPSITRGDGLSMKDPIQVLDITRGANIQVTVASGAKIQELNIHHKSDVLAGLGFPKVVAMTRLSQEEQAAINNAGVVWGNTPILDAQSVTFDFSALANNKQLTLGDYNLCIQVYDASMRLLEDTLRIRVIPDVDHAAHNVSRYEVWAKFATVSGQWFTTSRPMGIGLEYSSDKLVWTKVDNLSFDESNKTFSARLLNLTPGTTYYYRTYSNDFVSEDIKSFTTEQETQVPYLNFDIWFKSGKSWYVGEDMNSKIWDSGNEGANTVSAKNPTAPDAETKVNVEGNQNSAYLETKVVFGVMAAGNLYTGDFIQAVVDLQNPGAQLDFGIPYTARPTTLTGYYKYQPVNINYAKTPYENLKGKLDSCYIYVALFDWTSPFHVNTQTGTFVDMSKAIALGELKDSRTMNDFEKFTIDIKYRDRTKIPTYILIVATASKYGDYFTGGEGSKLWIDEFELGFEPPEK